MNRPSGRAGVVVRRNATREIFDSSVPLVQKMWYFPSLEEYSSVLVLVWLEVLFCSQFVCDGTSGGREPRLRGRPGEPGRVIKASLPAQAAWTSRGESVDFRGRPLRFLARRPRVPEQTG